MSARDQHLADFRWRWDEWQKERRELIAIPLAEHTGTDTDTRERCPSCEGIASWPSDNPYPVCRGSKCWPEEMRRALGLAEEEAEAEARESAEVDAEEARQDVNAAIRLIDLAELLATPPAPTPWRVHPFVADGTVTVLASESGVGKSMLGMALCQGVQNGRNVAGLATARGNALYVDAEMGVQMFARRTWAMMGAQAPSYEYADALGADISRVQVAGELERRITETEANLVVLDSLKALTPSKDENSNTDMGPVMQALLRVSRDTNAAIVLIHHKGSSEKAFRGATVIRDQCDALFSLASVGEDGRLKLWVPTDGKMRYAEKPEPLHLEINMLQGGVTAADAPQRGRPPVAVLKMQTSILAALPADSRAAVAHTLDLPPSNQTLRRAWDALMEDNRIERVDCIWSVVEMALPLGDRESDNPDAANVGAQPEAN